MYRGKDYQLLVDGEEFPGFVTATVSPRRNASPGYAMSGAGQMASSNDDGADITVEILQMMKEDIDKWKKKVEKTHGGKAVTLVLKNNKTGKGASCSGVMCNPLEDNAADQQHTIQATANALHHKKL